MFDDCDGFDVPMKDADEDSRPVETYAKSADSDSKSINALVRILLLKIPQSHLNYFRYALTVFPPSGRRKPLPAFNVRLALQNGLLWYCSSPKTGFLVRPAPKTDFFDTARALRWAFFTDCTQDRNGFCSPVGVLFAAN